MSRWRTVNIGSETNSRPKSGTTESGGGKGAYSATHRAATSKSKHGVTGFARAQLAGRAYVFRLLPPVRPSARPPAGREKRNQVIMLSVTTCSRWARSLKGKLGSASLLVLVIGGASSKRVGKFNQVLLAQVHVVLDIGGRLFSSAKHFGGVYQKRHLVTSARVSIEIELARGCDFHFCFTLKSDVAD